MFAKLYSVLCNCRTWAFSILISSYILFIIFGGSVLMVLEEPKETQLRSSLRILRSRFLQAHTCVSDEQLETFTEQVLRAQKFGIPVLINEDDRNNYDFTSSLFFLTAFLTTTGYLILGLISLMLVLETLSEVPGIHRCLSLFQMAPEKEDEQQKVLQEAEGKSKEVSPHDES
ncbi:KCNK1 protein, partial [Polypterus senegalus]